MCVTLAVIFQWFHSLLNKMYLHFFSLSGVSSHQSQFLWQKLRLVLGAFVWVNSLIPKKVLISSGLKHAFWSLAYAIICLCPEI